MSRFLTPLRTEQADGAADGSDLVILLSPLAFESDLLSRQVVVPMGFKTDYASVPRLPLAYWLFGGVARQAAVVHDFLYGQGELPREQADRVFLEAMSVSGVPAWRRWPMFYAVRAFGGPHYGPAARAAV